MLVAQLCLHGMSQMVVCGFKSLKVVYTGLQSINHASFVGLNLMCFF